MMETDSVSQLQSETRKIKQPEVNRWERHRLIAHLGRTFARRYDLQVLPSGEKGVWACGLDPKVTPEIESYIRGKRATLDDLSPESFTPKQILYDEQAAQQMEMREITTLLHHEAGHAKYTDFRLMFEGQRYAKDEGYLPTSFWLTFEGIEDPRVNALEGEESPAIDRQIRANQAKDLQDRITEAPLSDKPLMLQFAYNAFNYWLHGEGIPELQGTDVGRLGELARPLLEQYFQNTDVQQRRVLQKQIWDIAKELEKKDLEQEEQRQMASKQRGQGQQGGSGEGQASGNTQEGTGDQQMSSGGQGGGQESATPSIPGGKGGGMQQEQQEGQNNRQGESQGTGLKSFFEKLKDGLFGQKNKAASNGESGQQLSESEQVQQGQGDEQPSFGHETGKPAPKPRPERTDLSKLTPEELQAIKDAIDQLSPPERAELMKQAREAMDEAQKEALEEKLQKTLRLQKDKQTGEYEAMPQTADGKTQQRAQADYQKALQQTEAEEQAEWVRQEAVNRKQEELLRQIDAVRREKLEMEKAGFDEQERDKFLLYQDLENAMYLYVRNFRQAMERIIPRRIQPVYESGYFSGPRFDRRDLIRKAPVGDERFHMRQVERPTGEPRLFIALLVDNSSSMSGKKMQEARKTMVFFAQVCKEMGIPFMEAAFGDKAEVVKSFRQDFDNPVERIKPKIIDATDASGASTNMHAGMEITIEAMNEQRRRLRDFHGLILVITDGQANAGLTGDALRTYIEENRGRLTFKAFGLSGNDYERNSIQTYLNNYFGDGNCAYPEGIADLPDEAFRVLRVNLIQFQKYFV